MAHRLSLGISEDRDFEYPQIAADAFRENGRYGAALGQLKRLTGSPSSELWAKTYWDRCVASGSTLPAADYPTAREKYTRDISWILVLEAENARIWSEGPTDYKEALRRYQRRAHADSQRIRSAMEELQRFDNKHAYLLRHSLQHAMQNFLSDEKIRRVKRPNMNADKGYEIITVGGPAVRDTEFRFLSRLSFFELDGLLRSWIREIDGFFSEWPAHWKEFGALRFERPVSPVAAAKMNVVQLGLIARLTSRLRDFTAGYGIRVYSTGQPVPTHGKPCWDVVAEFLNCALEPTNVLTGETARRIWQSLAAKHMVTMQAWPKPSKSEPQAQQI